MPRLSFCQHAHFYQPPREDPFTGVIPQEIGAEPYGNFNEKITAECYQPNAEMGNFERISFNIGPTLALWMEKFAPATLDLIVAADKKRLNAVAQVYNHTILPLASSADKEIQIRWGITDFMRRFCRVPQGMWLAETAVDVPTLDALAKAGVAYTVLAPWQAAGTAPRSSAEVDTTKPYVVQLPKNRSITVFFFDPNFSVALHRTSRLTAQQIAQEIFPMRLDNAWFGPRSGQTLFAASDGEYFGHHYPGRDALLRDLTLTEGPAAGYDPISLNEWLDRVKPQDAIEIQNFTAWSCEHGLDRWSRDCECARDNSVPAISGNWKGPLRAAMNRLAEHIDEVYFTQSFRWLRNAHEARLAAIEPLRGWLDWDQFFIEQGSDDFVRAPESLRTAIHEKLRRLFLAQYYRQLMFTSCGFFFEDLSRIEPVNNIRYAAMAIKSTNMVAPEVPSFADAFATDLAECRSVRTGQSGAELFLREWDRAEQLLA